MNRLDQQLHRPTIHLPLAYFHRQSWLQQLLLQKQKQKQKRPPHKLQKKYPVNFPTEEDPLSISATVPNGNHAPFILHYGSRVLTEQLTLVERDALAEVDWKELCGNAMATDCDTSAELARLLGRTSA